MAKIGLDIHLFLDASGHLVITDKPRPELLPLKQTAGFTLHAPLDAVVQAQVEFIVGELDIDLPLDQARFVVGDVEVDAETLRALREVVKIAQESEGG